MNFRLVVWVPLERVFLLGTFFLMSCSSVDEAPLDALTSDAACDGGIPLQGPNGEATGLVKCGNGSILRVEAVSCAANGPAPSCELEFGECVNDADCTDGANGVCVREWDVCTCLYDCATDADCLEGEACACRAGMPIPGTTGGEWRWIGRSECVPASCRGSGNCEGRACAYSYYPGGCGLPVGFHCQGDDDACRGPADCGPGSACVYNETTSRWKCEEDVICE